MTEKKMSGIVMKGKKMKVMVTMTTEVTAATITRVTVTMKEEVTALRMREITVVTTKKSQQ